MRVWGRSSPGRALEWHSRGKGFDPPRLHQQKKPAIGNDGRLFPFDIIGFMSHDLSLLETHWKQIKNPLPINQEKNGKEACQERRYPGEINHRSDKINCLELALPLFLALFYCQPLYRHKL